MTSTIAKVAGKMYICIQKHARMGCASAIETSSIAFGLHRPYTKMIYHGTKKNN